MKSRLAGTTVALALLAAAAVLTVHPAATGAQPADSTAAPPHAAPPPAQAQPPPPPPPAATPPAEKSSGKSIKEKLYYGGTVSLSFGDADQIGFFPMIGYKVTPKLSAGIELGYQHVSYDEPVDESSDNYGAGVFGRYRLTPRIYGHAEYEAIRYEHLRTVSSESGTVNYLLVGGGYVMPVGPRTSVYAEVLFDVLQEEDSPYGDWEPFVSVGVGVGF
jgi:hypothetical protein